MINFLLETPGLYSKLKMDKNAFTDPIARNYFAFIGMTYATSGTFITRTHTERFLKTQGVKEMFDNLGKSGLCNTDNFLIHVNGYGTTKTYDMVENVLLDAYTRRRMIEVSEKMVELSENRRLSANEIVRKGSVELDKLLYQQSQDLVTLSTNDIMTAELEQLNTGEVEEYLPIGVNMIDDYSGGVPSPALVVTLAATKQGKSMLLYKMALKGLKEGRKVLLATIETGEVETRKKIMSLYSGIDYIKISKMTMNEEEKAIYREKLIEFNKLYADNFFIMYNRGGMSCKDIEIFYDTMKRAGIELNMLVVDYMGLLKSELNSKSKVEAMLELPKELRVLSQKTNTVVATAQQLHSAVASLDIEEINESKIFYISTLAHEATVTMILHKKDGEEDTKIRILRSRIASVDDIYYFPDKNFDKCDIGEDEIWVDENFI